MTHRIIALAALLALPACAALRPDGMHPRAELLSDAPPRPLDLTCRVSGYPRALPSADALVDSAGLTAAATAAWRASGRPPGHVLVGLRYSPDGLNVRRDIIEHRVDDALADTLQKLVFAHRRVAAPADHEWSVRLRVDLGETPALRVGRTEVCSPRPRGTSETGVARGMGGGAWGDVRSAFAPSSFAEEYQPNTVWVRVALDARGNVTDARVERSLARVALENRLLNYIRTISFIPAMEDGYPVPAQLSLPLSMAR
jgi:TonB family protein